MRYVGVLLTVLAGVGFGLIFAHRLTVRARFLNRSVRLLEALERQMSYTGLPLARLWHQLADGRAFGDFSLFADTLSALQDLPFEQAFGRAVQLATERGELSAGDAALLLECGHGCGRTDLVGQQKLLQSYREQLLASCKTAEQTAHGRGPVYRMLGLAGGVALALLIL